MIDPIVRAELLIRRPVAEVFEAFIDPAITSRFWFSRGTAKLTPGAELTWMWEMYGASTAVKVLEIEPNRLIRIDWNNASDPTRVEWRFAERGTDQTWVEIENSGFAGDEPTRLTTAIDSTGGFSLVLAGAKIWLEHGIEPNFVLDRHPDRRVEGWKDR
ncbi:MAG: polyketide cyclase [Rhizobium sp.]|nr:polyketide cyclase [Rhizobium sp.]